MRGAHLSPASGCRVGTMARMWLAVWVLPVLAVVMLAGCGASSAGQYPAGSDIARFNKRADATNHAWDQFRTDGNACAVNASAGPCLVRAMQDSALEPASDALRGHVEHVEGTVKDGPCRQALQALDARLGAFRVVLDRLRRDATGGQSLDVLLADTHRVRPGWNAATAAENHSTSAC